MTEFLMLFRGGKSDRLASSPEMAQAHMQRWGAWIGGIAEKGLLVGAQPLRGGGKVVTGTDKVVTDGPYTESKELVGGYLICKAESEEAATALSMGCPILEFEDGVVEIREINPMM